MHHQNHCHHLATTTTTTITTTNAVTNSNKIPLHLPKEVVARIASYVITPLPQETILLQNYL